MKKNKIMTILIVLAIFSIGVGFFMICKENVKANKKRDDIMEKLNFVLSSDPVQANFEFIDNYNNKRIVNNYINLSYEELINNGYVEYIQSSDYMVSFYSKIQIIGVDIKEETDSSIVCLVKVNRPNLFEIMNECDNENIDNTDYDFDSVFIDKMEKDTFNRYEETIEITIKKVGEELKFKYDDNFKTMLYC